MDQRHISVVAPKISSAFVRRNVDFKCVAGQALLVAKEVRKGVLLTCGTNDIEFRFEYDNKAVPHHKIIRSRRILLSRGDSSDISNLSELRKSLYVASSAEQGRLQVWLP